MKKMLLITTMLLPTLPAIAQQNQNQTTEPDIIANCNLQVGQTLMALGQAQQQIIVLQRQLSDVRKQVDELKANARK
jgi:hypothetical protein